MGKCSSKEEVAVDKSKATENKNKKKHKWLLEELEEHEGPINCMQLSDDGSLLVTGGEDCVARMWSTKTPLCEFLGSLEGHTDYITCIAIIDTVVLTGSADSTIRKWDMTTLSCLFVFSGHTMRIQRVICPGPFLFSTSYDKTARMWILDAEALGEANADKACIRVFQGHTKGVYPIMYVKADSGESHVDAHNNQMKINPADLLVTGSGDCTARSWSVDAASCLKVFDGHSMPVMCLAADQDGRTLMTAGGDSIIRSWELRTGLPLKEFVGHSSGVVALLVVNRMLYSCSCDQTVRAWVMEFGDCTRVFRDHQHTVTTVRYVDGLVLSGCGDGTARLFDAKSGALKQELKGHQGALMSLAVVDSRVYTSGKDGRLRVWDVSPLLGEPPGGHNNQLQHNNQKLMELERHLDGYVEQQHQQPSLDGKVAGRQTEMLRHNLPGVIA